MLTISLHLPLHVSSPYISIIPFPSPLLSLFLFPLLPFSLLLSPPLSSLLPLPSWLAPILLLSIGCVVVVIYYSFAIIGMEIFQFKVYEGCWWAFKHLCHCLYLLLAVETSHRKQTALPYTLATNVTIISTYVCMLYTPLSRIYPWSTIYPTVENTPTVN